MMLIIDMIDDEPTKLRLIQSLTNSNSNQILHMSGSVFDTIQTPK